MEKIYDKLVRNKIPSIIREQGHIPVTDTLSDSDYLKYLNKKLKEEVNEYSKNSSLNALCDIYEVFNTILEANNIEIETIEKMCADKRETNGSYKEKTLLKKVLYSCIQN